MAFGERDSWRRMMLLMMMMLLDCVQVCAPLRLQAPAGRPAGADVGWQVFSSVQDAEGRCICTVVAPQPHMCTRDARARQIRQLLERVQNMSQSMEALSSRTQSDMVYVRRVEAQMRAFESRFSQVQADRHALLHTQDTKGE
ncbi:noelin-like [Petromyzon marinus]|uniref:Noelin-like n=1 Tax=Petromyzon marinus TaxID=7757 RepID=A0AAJ7XF45_PETMA|nr:noelin-like [Petromyzon marinus]